MSAAEVDAYIRNRGAFYGTAGGVAQTIDEFVGHGCAGFIVFCSNFPAHVGLEGLASLNPPGGPASA